MNECYLPEEYLVSRIPEGQRRHLRKEDGEKLNDGARPVPSAVIDVGRA